MSQHLSDEQIDGYISRTLSPGELLKIDDHIAGCDACLQNMTQEQNISTAALQNILLAEEPAHLTYEEMSDLVDGRLDNVSLEAAALHRDSCYECSEEIENLLALRAALKLESGVQAATADRSSWFTGVYAKRSLLFAASAAAVVLIAAVAWYMLMNRTMPEGDTVAAVPVPQQSPPVVPQQADADNGQPTVSPKAVVSLNDGGRKIELDESGKLSGLGSPDLEPQYKAALSGSAIEIPADVRRLRSSGGVLMGGGASGGGFTLESPVGRVVESNRPVLKWQPLSGADKYKVGIFDENFNEVALSPELTATRWTPPELMRGRTYQWQVTAIRGKDEIRSPVRPAPEAKFKVVDQAHYAAIEKARRSGSHLLLGVAFANAGLIDDAERELKTVLQSNPDSDIVKRLIAEVRAAK